MDAHGRTRRMIGSVVVGAHGKSGRTVSSFAMDALEKSERTASSLAIRAHRRSGRSGDGRTGCLFSLGQPQGRGLKIPSGCGVGITQNWAPAQCTGVGSIEFVETCAKGTPFAYWIDNYGLCALEVKTCIAFSILLSIASIEANITEASSQQSPKLLQK